jgi:negative regulator of sigma E activity
MAQNLSTEERITAFLDGQLTDAEMAAFEADMEADPALAEAVARYGANDDMLRAAFDAPMQQGVDDALLARMGLNEPPSAQIIDIASARKAKMAPANDDTPGWQRWRWPALGAVAAAAVAIVMTQTGPATSPDAQFAQAMEATPSGQSAKLAGGETVQPLLTFQAGDGRYCREFSRSETTGIACRGHDGWSVEAKVKGQIELGNSGRIETAAGVDDGALADAYTRLKASDPLDSETEKALIAKGWDSPKK